MPDTKITALTALTAADPANDVLPIVDVSDTTMAASGTTKKISINNVLGCSGTATLASATISGDLTVDTSTLYVSSSADKVGIGTTSLSNEKLTVAGNISANAWLGRSNISVPAGDCSIFRSADNTLGFGIASTTAMTLNSTGLGIGTTVLGGNKLAIGSTSDTSATTNGINIVTNRATITTTCNGAVDAAGTTINYSWANGGQGPLIFRNAAISNVMTLDASGNCGIGVTPSAKLDVRGPNNGNQAIFTGTASRGLVISTRDDGLANDRTVIFNAAYAAGSLGQLAFQTAGTDRVLMKNNGQLRFVPLAADPAGAEAGDVYYNSTSNKLKCYNGTTWNDLF